MVFNPDLDRPKILPYTEELKDWIVDLRKHLVAITVPLASPQTAQPDNLPAEKRPRLDHEYAASWTWDDLKCHVDQLEENIERIADELNDIKLFHTFTTIMDTTGNGQHKTVVERAKSLGETSDPVLGLLQRANGTGEELGNQAALTARLLLKVHRGEETIKLLETQKQEHESMKSEVRRDNVSFWCFLLLICKRLTFSSQNLKDGVKRTRKKFVNCRSKSKISGLVLEQKISLPSRKYIHESVLPSRKRSFPPWKYCIESRLLI
jgi:hypothetical protein